MRSTPRSSTDSASSGGTWSRVGKQRAVTSGR
jgi:hypothetical protein